MPQITLISDTHGSHYELGRLKPCDLLVHCGDCTSDGGLASLRDFLRWFESQPAPEKCLVVGNHDWIFEKEPGMARMLVAELAPSVRYLEDHGELIAGINLWGSPVQPLFNAWAFNRERGEEIKRHWDKIPHGVDLLITHGPPHGILDKSKSPGHDDNLGCEELLKCVKRIKPKVHAFGHIHGSAGLQMKDGTLFVNASILDEQYLVKNKPITINL